MLFIIKEFAHTQKIVYKYNNSSERKRDLKIYSEKKYILLKVLYYKIYMYTCVRT